MSEDQYQKAMEEYAGGFEAGMGAAAIRECLKALDLDSLSESLAY